jgi:two-component system cell cycle sensor histidine kinase/response regulator CckA
MLPIAALETSLDGILVLDGSNRVLRCNQRFLQLFALTAAQVARHSGDEVLALLKPHREPGFPGSPDDLFSTNEGLIVERCVVPTVSPAAVSSTPPEVLTAEAPGRIEVYRDVSDWHRRLQAACSDQARLQTAQEIACIGSWSWDAGLDPHTLHCSAEAARIIGITPEQFPVTPEGFLELVYGDDRDAVRRAAAAAHAAGEVHEIDHRIVRHDHDLCWLHVKARVVRDERGVAIRMLGTVQDTTKRRLLEEQLRHSQKLEAIGRLAGGVAHDLNNALTAIIGYTELVLAGIPESDPAWPDVREISRAAERAESVTRQLLAFSRKQRLEPRVFHLNQAIESLGNMLKRLLGVEIEIDTVLDEELPPIYGDPGQIQQALINLAVNARDAMEGGGRLSIRIRLVQIDEAFARAHLPMPAGEYVELAVSDTGVGMSAETQAHMFEPFFTTKEAGKGTGLGLPMVHGTVQQSGGFIFAESTIGSGTTFHVYFPPAAMPEAGDGLPVTIEPDAATILVAEDEIAVRTLVAAALSSQGYRVLQAGSGAEALSVAAGYTDPIRLLLTDANMPGMNGVELANELVRRRGDMHIVIMSGYTVEALSVSGITQPVAFLPKPFTPRDLRQKIREVLARRG